MFLCCHIKNRLLRLFFAKWLTNKYHIEVASSAKIGWHFMVPHPRNIIIAGNVVIGDYCQVNQDVTIGGNMKKTKQRDFGLQKMPIIGDKVLVYTGAVIGGPVMVGSNVIIGANCVVTHDVESNSIVKQSSETIRRKIDYKSGFKIL